MEKIGYNYLKDILYIGSSIITIFTFIFSIQIIPPWSEMFSNYIGNMTLASRAIIFIIFEFAVCYMFAFLILKSCFKIRSLSQSMITISIMGLVSAWVSFYLVFNTLIVDFGNINNALGGLILFFLGASALGIEFYFIEIVFREHRENEDDDWDVAHTTFRKLFMVLPICFLIIYLAIIIDNGLYGTLLALAIIILILFLLFVFWNLANQPDSLFLPLFVLLLLLVLLVFLYRLLIGEPLLPDNFTLSIYHIR